VRLGPIVAPLESCSLAESLQTLRIDTLEFREELRDGDIAEIID